MTDTPTDEHDPFDELVSLVTHLHEGNTPAALFGFSRLVRMIELLATQRDEAFEALALRAVAQERIDSEAAAALTNAATEIENLRKELSDLRRARAH